MKISKKIQKEELFELEIETPAFYKLPGYDYCKFYRVISENDITEVNLDIDYTTIKRMTYGHFYRADNIFTGEAITEEEFHQSLAKAITNMAAKAELKTEPKVNDGELDIDELIKALQDCVAELKCYDLSKETLPVMERAQFILDGIVPVKFL